MREIRARGGGPDDDGFPRATTVTVGGGCVGGAITYAVDDLDFYLSMRKIAVARAKLYRKDTSRVLKRTFGDYDSRTHEDIFRALCAHSSARKYAHMQLMRLMMLTAAIADWAARQLAAKEKLDARSVHLDVVIPDVSVPESPPDDLRTFAAVASAVTDYFNKLDLHALGLPQVHMQAVPSPPVLPDYKPSETVTIDYAAPDEELARLTAVEEEIAAAVRVSDEWLATVTNQMGEVFEKIRLDK